MTDRIFDICNDYLRIAFDEFEIEDEEENFKHRHEIETDVIRYYLHASLRAAMIDYVNFRRHHTDNADKSVRNILIDALDYFVNCLVDSNKNCRYLMRLFVHHFLFGSYSDSEIDQMADERQSMDSYIDVKINDEIYNLSIPQSQIKTIIQLKKTISMQIKVPIQQLYVIKYGGNEKPNDKDNVDYYDRRNYQKYFIEVVSSIEDIDILKCLAKGGFGEVSLCQHKVSRKQFVVKQQLKNDSDLHREIGIQSHLQHSYIIEHYSGLIDIEGKVCMAMKYMPEGSLTSYLKIVNYLSEIEIAKICHQILLQIKEIHRKKIIHRDLNCNNIVLDERHNAKLIDFGISKCTYGVSDEQLKENLKYINGNRRFFAPEYLKGELYTNKIDIWSLGAVIIQMVTGKEPYDRLTDFAASERILQKKEIKFNSSKHISEELANFIRLCLTPTPKERPNADELIQSPFIQNYLNKINE